MYCNIVAKQNARFAAVWAARHSSNSRIGRCSVRHSDFVADISCDFGLGAAFGAAFSVGFDSIGKDLEGPPVL